VEGRKGLREGRSDDCPPWSLFGGKSTKERRGRTRTRTRKGEKTRRRRKRTRKAVPI